MIKEGKRLVRKLLKDPTEVPQDFDEVAIATWRAVEHFTMTSAERINALCQGVEYVVRHNIPGDIVECGVWRGGSMMAVARTLMRLGATRNLHLFDTFEGMSEPTEADKDPKGQLAAALLAKDDKSSWNWAYAPLQDVQAHLKETGYDLTSVRYVVGKVEDTVPASAPAQIALLRLDTDWYESTYHELIHLYPRLSVGGVLVIDDYGHWEGARKAVDQYIAENNLKLLLNRIDYTGRIAVKVE